MCHVIEVEGKSTAWNTRRVHGGVKPSFYFVTVTPESIDNLIKLLKYCCMPATQQPAWNASTSSESSSSRRKDTSTEILPPTKAVVL